MFQAGSKVTNIQEQERCIFLMISSKKFYAHEVLGRHLAFGRGDLSFVWKEVTKFEEP